MAGYGKTNISPFGRISTGCLGLWLAGLISLLLAIPGCAKKKPPPPAPPDVQVLTVTPTNVPIYQEWIGTLDGSVNAQIRAQVTGYLLKQNYAEGSHVKAGDLLFQIDPRPFQALLDQAKANLAQSEAQLQKSELDVKRYTPLAKDQAISQQTLDDAIQATSGAQAQITANKAAIESATLNLDFTKITSPIDGLAGLAQVHIGDLVSPSSGVLTTVSSLDPIRVFFQVNERSYLDFWRRIIEADGTNSSSPELELILSDGTTYPERGKFFFADRQIDVNTGTLQIVGLFPNKKFMLRPGQFARVRAHTLTRTNAILVPQRAVSQLQGSYQVAVVGESNKVNIASVTVGEQIGSDWIIEKGLKPGARVVVEGTQKAKEGTVVNPQPWTPPKQPEEP